MTPSLLSPLPFPNYFSLINDKTVLINHDRKTSFGLIQDGLFSHWKFGFVFDPQLHDL